MTQSNYFANAGGSAVGPAGRPGRNLVPMRSPNSGGIMMSNTMKDYE